MRLPPIGEAAVAFTLVVGKGGIDVAEAAIGDFGRFDHAARVAAAVEHNPAFACCRRVRFVLGAAGRGLDAFDDEVEQFVGKLRAVAERIGPDRRYLSWDDVENPTDILSGASVVAAVPTGPLPD